MTPYQQGYAAYNDNRTAASNPFTNGSPNWYSWNRGYFSAKEDSGL